MADVDARGRFAEQAVGRLVPALTESRPLRPKDLITTYRFLRVGMIGAVVLLAASIGIERSEVDCFQTSISAYYYTPVRAIFVGSMMAVGLALIVYRGRSSWEDACLHFSGMLAPLVAIAPTTDVGTCWSVEPDDPPINADGSLAPWVTDNIDNNLNSLLIAGLAGLVAAVVITMRANRSNLLAELRELSLGTQVTLVGTMLALPFVWWSSRAWDDFHTRAHGYAAVLMFVFLIGAVIFSAGGQWTRRHEQKWFRSYGAVALLMVLGAVVALVGGNRWFGDHVVLYLEAYEILLFGIYWSLQTIEKWEEEAEELATPSGAGDGQGEVARSGGAVAS